MNTTRSVEKATHVPVRTEVPRRGSALVKFGYLRRLALQPGDVEAVRQALGARSEAVPASLWPTLSAFEGSPLPSTLPQPAELVDVPSSTLLAVGQALTEVRRRASGDVADAALPSDPDRTSADLATGGRTHLLNTALGASATFRSQSTTSPVGMLNLERIEMTPVGIGRGELIATIPLAPLEETAVVQKEWSVTTKEYTSIVTDSLENYSESGVTDNTELAQSTNAQISHNNQFNITGTVSGGIPLMSGSVTSSFGAQDATSTSAAESRRHTVSVTQKASSRVKQEHKVTISTVTVTGASEATTRTLRNPSRTRPMRVDYFSMMRRWLVRLYRYGLRLTYDVVIPEPGGALRASYARLAELQEKLGPFRFDVPHTEITEQVWWWAGETQPHYLVLAERYGAVVPVPPAARPPVRLEMTAPDTDGARIFASPPLAIPDGYWITKLWLRFYSDSRTHTKYRFQVLGSTLPVTNEDAGDHGPTDLVAGGDLAADANGRMLLHATGSCTVSFRVEDNRQTWISLTAEIEPSEESVARWKADVWQALYSAAQARYYSEQQDVATRIAALEDQLNHVDTLTLRREESTEVMKGVLRFLLGPDFEFMPQHVIDAIVASGADPVHGVGFTGNAVAFKPSDWSTLSQHEDLVRFVNQAIEWENVASLLYSYFWDVPTAWDFIRQIRHPDATRQAFLRAGSARVILTVRKGWEEAWVRFVEGGHRNARVDDDHPYLTLAREVAAYDDTNYPGIPPANPGRAAVRLEDAVYTTSTDTVSPNTVGDAVTITVESTAGFVVGLPVVIGAPGTPTQELQTLTTVDGDTRLTVAALSFPHDGGKGPFPVFQPGDKGALIAEWDEYTPTSGTDIAITSDLATIA